MFKLEKVFQNDDSAYIFFTQFIYDILQGFIVFFDDI